jgi:hypothetical protein
VAEDDGAKAKIRALFADRDESLEMLKMTLNGKLTRFSTKDTGKTTNDFIEQLNALEDDEESDRDTADMLNTLLRFL